MSFKYKSYTNNIVVQEGMVDISLIFRKSYVSGSSPPVLAKFRPTHFKKAHLLVFHQIEGLECILSCFRISISNETRKKWLVDVWFTLTSYFHIKHVRIKSLTADRDHSYGFNHKRSLFYKCIHHTILLPIWIFYD